MHYGRYGAKNITSVMHYGRYGAINITSVMHYGRYGAINITSVMHDGRYGRDGSTGGVVWGVIIPEAYPGGYTYPQEALKMLENCLKIGYFQKKSPAAAF